MLIVNDVCGLGAICGRALQRACMGLSAFPIELAKFNLVIGTCVWRCISLVATCSREKVLVMTAVTTH
jgi:hypothetical protein